MITQIASDHIVAYRNASQMSERFSFAQAIPFPHIVIDNFLQRDVAMEAAKVFPLADSRWTNYLHVNEKKFGLNKRGYIPDRLIEVIDHLQSSSFLKALSEMTGIPGIIADETLAGGGLHQVHPGGFLNMHSDFLVHPSRQNLRRRINLILFLSDRWQEEYGGELEFWDKEMKQRAASIQPVFNRCVIFQTDEHSYHGCPEKLRGPNGFTRNSIALYYYTEYAHTPSKLFTDYKARPFDRNKILIWLDGKAVAVYSWIKTKLGINDEFVSRVLKLFKGR